MTSHAQNLRAARRQAGLTQAELANRAKVSQSVVAQSENGREISLRVKEALAAALNLEVRGLFPYTIVADSTLPDSYRTETRLPKPAELSLDPNDARIEQDLTQPAKRELSPEEAFAAEAERS